MILLFTENFTKGRQRYCVKTRLIAIQRLKHALFTFFLSTSEIPVTHPQLTFQFSSARKAGLLINGWNTLSLSV